MTNARTSGFTLIELLIVVSIMAILSAMLMPMISMAQRGAKKTNSQNLLRKVDIALKAFQGDVGHFPWVARPASSSVSLGAPWNNNLAFRLHHTMSSAELDALSADRAAVPGVFNGGAQDWTASGASQINQPGFVASGIGDASQLTRNRIGQAQALNRLSIERALVGIMSGNTSIAGVAYSTSWGPGATILANPKSNGFSDDYLGADIQEKEFTTRTITVGTNTLTVPYDIVDLYNKMPLIYIHSQVNGVRGGFPYPFYESSQLRGTFPRINASFYALTPTSRAITTTLASDARDTADRPYIAEFELWSCGPDNAFDAQRNAGVNKDGISALNYWKGLNP